MIYSEAPAAAAVQTRPWMQLNQEYLEAALDWLRLLLEGGPHDPRLVQAQGWMDQLAASDPAPALALLGQRFGLTGFEQLVLLLCLGMELDEAVPSLVAQAGGLSYGEMAAPTFSLAFKLYGHAGQREYHDWQALSPHRPLRYWRLVEVHQPGARPLVHSALRIDERILAAARGELQLDERLALLLSPLAPPGLPGSPIPLPPSQDALAEAIVQRAYALADGQALPDQPALLQLTGVDTPSKQAIAAAAAGQLGVLLYRLPADVLADSHSAAGLAEMETLARLWSRETVLAPVALYLELDSSRAPDNPETSPAAADGRMSPLLRRFLSRLYGLVFLDARQAEPGLGRGADIFDVERPTPQEQEAAWAAALGQPAPPQDRPSGDALNNTPAGLAALFNFDVGTIYQLARDASYGTGEAGQSATREKGAADPVAAKAPLASLDEICRHTTRLRMQGLAERIRPVARLEQVILPPESKAHLEQIVLHARHRLTVYDDWGYRQRLSRGLGISALFAGESGTGKTMAAEAIAHTLGLDLYRIDLSGVVSKYIGETEKNLRRVFEEAEATRAILFFDEADALYGKRSEVKDSHDRYANIEVSYLLQRMESYQGVAILATNMKSALDVAFLRRLRFVVVFPFPGQEDRGRIWQQAFPPQLVRRLRSQDWERLAAFPLTGGHIMNVALNAAFLAAGEGKSAVHMEHILHAARLEFDKLEQPVNDTTFS
jgi:hypothetical protein